MKKVLKGIAITLICVSCGKETVQTKDDYGKTLQGDYDVILFDNAPVKNAKIWFTIDRVSETQVVVTYNFNTLSVPVQGVFVKYNCNVAAYKVNGNTERYDIQEGQKFIGTIDKYGANLDCTRLDANYKFSAKRR